MCITAQSCRQKPLAIHDAVSDNKFDVTFFTETWLYSQGDEAYLAQITPEGYFTKSFPREGKRGGGIAVTMRNSLKEYCTFHRLPSVSFEGVSLKIKCKDIVLKIVCLYRPPPSRHTKCNAQTFITEFSNLLEQYIAAPGDLLITGDFNFHYDQPNSADVSRLRTLLHDNRLRQVLHEPTHRKGHTLDWLVVCKDCSLHQAGVMDLALVDHKAVVSTAL